VADVLAAEQDEQVQIGQGDMVLIRIGHWRRRKPAGALGRCPGPGRAAPAVLPLLTARRIAALGSDDNNDTAPAQWQASTSRRTC
jgi:hypothetical protein